MKNKMSGFGVGGGGFSCLCYRSQSDHSFISRINLKQLGQLSHTIFLLKQKWQLHLSTKQPTKPRNACDIVLIPIQCHWVVLSGGHGLLPITLCGHFLLHGKVISWFVQVLPLVLSGYSMPPALHWQWYQAGLAKISLPKNTFLIPASVIKHDLKWWHVKEVTLKMKMKYRRMGRINRLTDPYQDLPWNFCSQDLNRLKENVSSFW